MKFLLLFMLFGAAGCQAQHDDPFLRNLAKAENLHWEGNRYLSQEGELRAFVYKSGKDWMYYVYLKGEAGGNCCEDSRRSAMVNAAILVIDVDHIDNLDVGHGMIDKAYADAYAGTPR